MMLLVALRPEESADTIASMIKLVMTTSALRYLE